MDATWKLVLLGNDIAMSYRTTQLTVFRQGNRNKQAFNVRWRKRPTTCHQRAAAFEYCINIQPARKPWNSGYGCKTSATAGLAWLRERVGDAAIAARAGMRPRRLRNRIFRGLPATRPVRSQAFPVSA